MDRELAGEMKIAKSGVVIAGEIVPSDDCPSAISMTYPSKCPTAEPLDALRHKKVIRKEG